LTGGGDGFFKGLQIYLFNPLKPDKSGGFLARFFPRLLIILPIRNWLIYNKFFTLGGTIFSFNRSYQIDGS
jgi:hypothetical protein